MLLWLKAMQGNWVCVTYMKIDMLLLKQRPFNSRGTSYLHSTTSLQTLLIVPITECSSLSQLLEHVMETVLRTDVPQNNYMDITTWEIQ